MERTRPTRPFLLCAASPRRPRKSSPAFVGLDPAATVLLVVTFDVAMLTFTGGRTNMLQGLIHLVLFLAYIVLIFSP